jgi:8-oxo-dGTP pyrophosphatase MutT (NUDIX family)
MQFVKQGSGCIILAKNTKKILLPHRSKQVGQPNTWGTWGGFSSPDEIPQETAKRELREESGYNGNIELIKLSTMNWFVFKYHNFLGIIDEEFTPCLNWETQDYKWVEFGNWPSPIHFGLQWLLENDSKIIEKLVHM